MVCDVGEGLERNGEGGGVRRDADVLKHLRTNAEVSTARCSITEHVAHLFCLAATFLKAIPNLQLTAGA